LDADLRLVAPCQVEDVGIVRVRASPLGDWIFVTLQTKDGRIGLGEASQTGHDALTARCLLETVRPALRGRDAHRIHLVLRELRQALAVSYSANVVTMTALSAVEHAMWDLLGQHFGVPVHALWGGAARATVALYANLNRALVSRGPDGFANLAREAVAAGHHALKIAPFDDVERDTPDRHVWRQRYLLGLERIAATRDAVGFEVDLMVDCHGRFTPAEVPKLMRDVERFDVLWVEEPFLSTAHQPGIHAFYAQFPFAVAAGEYVSGLGEFGALLDTGVRYLMMDVKHSGGLWQVLRAAAVAEARGALVSLHSPSGPVAQAASAHVAAVLPNFHSLEYVWAEVPWRADAVHPREEIANGTLIVPHRPGLGVTLNLATLNTYAVDPLEV
jgi:galactonate dehydratase